MKISDYSINYVQDSIRSYQELEMEIIQLTGFNFITLRNLFASGYTLFPPKNDSSLSELGKKMRSPLIWKIRQKIVKIIMLLKIRAKGV